MLQTVMLQGERVRLLPLAPEHAPHLFEAGRAPEIWTYFFTRFDSPADAERFVADALAEQAQGSALPFAIQDRTSEQLVGSTRLLDFLAPHRQVEIGATWLSPQAWRTPINTECKYLLLRHCFETLGLVRVQLKTDARNERSQRAIARLGAVREGVLRRHRILPDGFVRDSVVYSITDFEWPQVKARLEGLLA